MANRLSVIVSRECLGRSRYKDKKQTAFESKEYKFKLREATPDGMVRTIAVVTVDMAEYLSVEETSCPTLQLMMETDGVDNAALMVDLSWGFAKEGKPDDDDVMSTQSAEEEIEDGPNEMDSSYRLPEEADDEETDERPEQDTSAFVQMRFSVFLQEEGEEEFDASCHPDWVSGSSCPASSDGELTSYRVGAGNRIWRTCEMPWPTKWMGVACGSSCLTVRLSTRRKRKICRHRSWIFCRDTTTTTMRRRRISVV